MLTAVFLLRRKKQPIGDIITNRRTSKFGRRLEGFKAEASHSWKSYTFKVPYITFV
jgi:hypothetical protein